MQLAEFIKWIMTVGAAALSFWIMERVRFFDTLGGEAKRILSFVLTSAIAIAGYWIGVALGYETLPMLNGAIDTVSLIETLFMVASVATGLAQIIHGRKVLASKVRVGKSKVCKCS